MQRVKFDVRLLAVQAAYLTAEYRYSQEDIAELLGVSQSMVSRALGHARAIKCLEETTRFVRPADFGDERMRDLEQLEEYAELADGLKGLKPGSGAGLRELRVFDAGTEMQSARHIEDAQRRFGTAAARRVAELLSRATLIGVAWGSTLSRLIDALVSLGYAWPDAPGRRIIPVSAEPMRFAHNEYTSSTLARRLDAIMNGEAGAERRLRALTGVPALIPSDLSRILPETRKLPKEARDDLPQILRSFFEVSSSAYREIFSGDDPLIARLSVLTSVGTSDKPMGFCKDDLLKFSGLETRSLQRLVVGDIGGVLLARPGLSAKDAGQVDKLNDLWTGMRREHLTAIARRAQQSGEPGIILVAIGASRSAVVCEALAQGLCTELIIDRTLARALPDELRRRFPGRAIVQPARKRRRAKQRR
jgi:DNA-binding transcriptional regulator LsrR (DeoR family)